MATNSQLSIEDQIRQNPPKIYEEDLVVMKSNKGKPRVGVVFRLGWKKLIFGEDADDDDDEEDEDMALDVDEVLVFFADNAGAADPISKVKYTQLTVADRALVISDVVVRADDEKGQIGTAMDVNVLLDLKFLNGKVMEKIPGRYVSEIIKMQRIDFVMERKDKAVKIGHVVEVKAMIIVAVEGAEFEIEDSSLEELLGENEAGDITFFPGQTISAPIPFWRKQKKVSGTYKPKPRARKVTGVVKTVKAEQGIVHWRVVMDDPTSVDEAEWKIAQQEHLYGMQSLLDQISAKLAARVASQQSENADENTSKAAGKTSFGDDDEDISGEDLEDDENMFDPYAEIQQPLDNLISADLHWNSRTNATSKVAVHPDIFTHITANGIPEPDSEDDKKLTKLAREYNGKCSSSDNVAEVIVTSTFATIQWQDGSVQNDVSSLELLPFDENLDVYFTPGDYVIDQLNRDRGTAFVVSVNTTDQTATLLFEDRSKPNPDGTFPFSERATDYPVYSLASDDTYSARPGDVCVTRDGRVGVITAFQPEGYVLRLIENDGMPGDLVTVHPTLCVSIRSSDEYEDEDEEDSDPEFDYDSADGFDDEEMLEGLDSEDETELLKAIGKRGAGSIGKLVSKSGFQVKDITGLGDDEDDEDDGSDDSSLGEYDQPLSPEEEAEMKNMLSFLTNDENSLINQFQKQKTLEDEEEKKDETDAKKEESSAQTEGESDVSSNEKIVPVDSSSTSSFLFLDSPPADHHYLENPFTPQPNFSRAVHKELREYSKGLPPGIYLRSYESHTHLHRFLIIGAPGTIYCHSYFFFDVILPPSYPEEPPTVCFISHGVRLHPNLYENVSLLGTWKGDASESWNPKTSSLLQLALSIQGLILGVKEPYYLEAGFEGHKGVVQAAAASGLYNEKACFLSLHMLCETLIISDPSFQDIIVQSWKEHRQDLEELLIHCDQYLAAKAAGEPLPATPTKLRELWLIPATISLGFAKILQSNIRPKFEKAKVVVQ